MAIAFVAATSQRNDNSATITQALDVGSDTNRYLIVGVACPADDVTGITYAGVAMTLNGAGVAPGGNVIDYWYLANPASGSNNIVVSRSAAPGRFAMVASAYFGVEQAAPDVTEFPTGGFGTTFSDAITTTADNSWVVWVVGSNNDVGQTMSAGANTTQRAQESNIAIQDSNSAVTPAGSYTLNAANTQNADAWGAINTAIGPAVAVGPANLSSMNGVAKATISSVNGTSLANITSINSVT